MSTVCLHSSKCLRDLRIIQRVLRVFVHLTTLYFRVLFVIVVRVSLVHWNGASPLTKEYFPKKH